jgi:ubiquinone/menaquinone biosynthesis C-methylase UbiE
MITGLVIDPASRFANKARNYELYRWDYSPQAIEAILNITRLSSVAAVADIGAGTGLLSQHFVRRVGSVVAIEPNGEMRRLADQKLASESSYKSVKGTAEATSLPGHSIDLIVVGRAIHWFDPSQTRAEFIRILKPAGYLAILRVPCTDKDLDGAVRSIRTVENGWNMAADKRQLEQAPLSFYFGAETFSSLQFPAVVTERWEEFLGRLSSFSPAPDEGHPQYKKFKNAAQKIFKQYSQKGLLTINIATELYLGQIRITGEVDLPA